MKKFLPIIYRVSKMFAKRGRLLIQLFFTAFSNGFYRGFAEGRIYQGDLKRLCLPGLNCYSCPGALGACPIGSLQATLADGRFRFPFYVAGFLLFFGAIFGRFVCGFLCPFGLVQELLHKIPFPKKLRTLPGERFLRKLKYVILAVFVILLPLVVLDITGHGEPWFCKYICPSGMLFGGLPLVASNPPLQAALGFLFRWKLLILAAVILLSLMIYRPFCRYLCPLGAIYGFFNKNALLRYTLDRQSCISCDKCSKACPMAIDVRKDPNSMECIRCGACRAACPKGCIRCSSLTFRTSDSQEPAAENMKS